MEPDKSATTAMEAMLLRGLPLVYCWGFNVNGQCAIFGQEDVEVVTSPNPVLPSPSVQMQPSLFASQMPGNAPVLPATATTAAEFQLITAPHMVRFFLDKPAIRMITTGGNHSLALTEDGSLWVWGANNDSQLGLGHTDPVLGPVELTFFRDRGDQIAALYGGYNYSLTLTANGELYSWGYNNFGQLGLGHTSQHASTPQLVSFFSSNRIRIKEIATGGNHVLLLTQDNRVYCWGYNKYGQLGLKNNYNCNSPQLIPFFDETKPVVSVGAGQRHSLVLTASGEVYSFGHNHYGALALGHDGDCSGPEHVKFFQNKKVKQIVAAGYHSLFLTDDNRLWSCGYNFTGELGIGNKENSLIPRPITFFENKAPIVSVAVGSQHTLVLLEDGEVYSWGYNKFGQLGLANTQDQLLPEPVPFFKGCPIVQIYGGYRHTLLLAGSLTPPPTPLQKSLMRLLRDTHQPLFSDIEITVSGVVFSLHRPILLVRSPQLLQIATQQQKLTQPSAMMVDSSGADPSAASGSGSVAQDVADFFLSGKMSPAAFRLLLAYIYAEEIPSYGVPVPDLIHLIVAATKLNLLDLERIIYLQLARLINPGNVLQSLEVAIGLEFEPLKDYCLRYIAFHKSKFPTQQLKALMKGRFDEEIIWSIMGLMDDLQPPTFPHLPAMFSAPSPQQIQRVLAQSAGKTPSQGQTTAATVATSSAASRMVRGNRPPSQLLTDMSPHLVTSLSRDLLKLFESSTDTDVQIICGDTSIQAHRCVLGARNAWFEIALTSGLRESKTGVIRIPGPSELNGMSPSALHALIKYLYTAKLDHIVDPSDALYLLSNAPFFLLSPDTSAPQDVGSSEDHVDLLLHCEQTVLEPLTVRNCLGLLQQIDRLGLHGTRLRERVLSFIVENYVEIATTSSQLLDIPERTYREVQIQFNMYILQHIQATDNKPLQAMLSLMSPLAAKSPMGSRRANSGTDVNADQMDVYD